MGKIRSYSLFRTSAKLEKPISDATHTLTEISFIVVRLETDNGITGESYLLSFQYSPQAIVGALRDVGEALIGENTHNTRKAFDQINQHNEYFGQEGVNRWAQAAYNIAMWDAWGKELKRPVWQVLGCAKTEVPIYGSGGWLSYSIDELLDEVSNYKKRGFRAVKIKVGKPDWREDLERLSMVRETVGDDVRIMMDANQGMKVPEAIALAQGVRDLGIRWFEEPVDHADFQGYQQIKAQTGISLAMGEREYSTLSLLELIRRNAIDIWQPDILRLGGVEAWKDSAALAVAYHVPVLPHYYKDYDISLLCTIANGAGAESFDWIDPLIDHPLQVKGGMASPHDRAGWGFGFKDSVLEEV